MGEQGKGASVKTGNELMGGSTCFQARWYEVNPQKPHGGEEEVTPKSYPLTSKFALRHICAHTKKRKKFISQTQKNNAESSFAKGTVCERRYNGREIHERGWRVEMYGKHGTHSHIHNPDFSTYISTSWKQSTGELLREGRRPLARGRGHRQGRRMWKTEWYVCVQIQWAPLFCTLIFK